jgi:hypothetical protein
LALDIDDWEMGFIFESIYWEMRVKRLDWFREPLSPLYTRILDRQVGRADAVTVTTSFLQDRYGGEWIPHTRDAQIFSPPLQEHPGPPRVVFLGTVRPHKGLHVPWRHDHAASAQPERNVGDLGGENRTSHGHGLDELGGKLSDRARIHQLGDGHETGPSQVIRYLLEGHPPLELHAAILGDREST